MNAGISTMTRRFTKMAVLALSLGGAVWATPSFAQSCGEDMQKLAQRREAELANINGLVKAAHGKQLDPAVFCAKSAGLNSAENAMIAYMEKNKDWCQIPDEAIAGLKATHAKSLAFSSKACAVAAQIKKMKEQQAAGGGPQAQPLPTGPL
jgi:hypothetical protein